MQKADASNPNQSHRAQPPRVLDEGAYFYISTQWLWIVGNHGGIVDN